MFLHNINNNEFQLTIDIIKEVHIKGFYYWPDKLVDSVLVALDNKHIIIVVYMIYIGTDSMNCEYIVKIVYLVYTDITTSVRRLF